MRPSPNPTAARSSRAARWVAPGKRPIVSTWTRSPSSTARATRPSAVRTNAPAFVTATSRPASRAISTPPPGRAGSIAIHPADRTTRTSPGALAIARNPSCGSRITASRSNRTPPSSRAEPTCSRSSESRVASTWHPLATTAARNAAPRRSRAVTTSRPGRSAPSPARRGGARPVASGGPAGSAATPSAESAARWTTSHRSRSTTAIRRGHP